MIDLTCAQCGKTFRTYPSHIKIGRKYCSHACMRLGRRIRGKRWLETHPGKPGPNGCILWTGSTRDKGYGITRYNRITMHAHRAAYQSAYGDVPPGVVVMHRCDNPPCINPEHLVAGTAQDNMADKVQKQRHSHGEKHGMAKLTESQVVQVRQRLSEKESLSSIARSLSVSVTAIYSIAHGKSWRHLPISA